MPSSLKKALVATTLLASTASASAADYFVVVPMPNHTAAASNIQVSLSGYGLPQAQQGTPYAGFDFNSLLQVTGDPQYSPNNVRWTVSGGTLPAGLALSASGKLTGTPSAAGEASFQVMASYKTKTGQQAYQLFVARLPGNGTLSVTALSFGGQAVGSSSATQPVTLKNIGGDTLNVGDIQASGPFSVSNNCATTLAPNASCELDVRFSPNSIGDASGAVTVATSSGTLTGDLSGTGQATQLVAAPSALDFSVVPAGSSGSQSFRLQNNGNIPTTSLTYTLPAEVTEADDCGQALSGGADCTVTLSWAPVSGPLSGTVKVSAQDSSASLTLSGSMQQSVQYLVVGGGGGGGVDAGGGAGGVLQGSAVVQAGTPYSVVVGAGGPAVFVNSAFVSVNGNGGQSSFGTLITAKGGGSGATNYTLNGGGPVSVNSVSYMGSNGASGGGSGGNSTASNVTLMGGMAVGGQGHNGGSMSGVANSPGGGGGGAGAAGGNATSSAPGAGGIGIQSSITGTATYYGGGGGGGSYGVGGAAGGLGGGGAGSQRTSVAGSGAAGTGGGGGGSGVTAGAGGSGTVILSEPLTMKPATTTCSPTVLTTSTARVYVFSSNCSITF